MPKRRRLLNPAGQQRRMARERAFRELRQRVDAFWFAYQVVTDADTFDPKAHRLMMRIRAEALELIDDMLAAPELIDPASIEVKPYQGKFAVFAGGKLLKDNFLTQPLAHMWLRRHLRGNGQIVGDPDTVIEWTGATNQSRSVH
jgi:hypothetical protein